MNYISTVEFQSQIAPGVVYKLRKMSHGRRLELEIHAAPIYAQINEKQRELSAVQAEVDRAEAAARIEPCSCNHDEGLHDPDTGRCRFTGCTCREPKPDPAIGDYAKLLALQLDIYKIVTQDLYPIYIRWGVSEVQGLKIDDQEATPDTLIKLAPEELTKELGTEIQRIIRLSPEEVMGFKSPTTSGVVADGPMTNTTAPPVKETASTKDGDAVAISPV